MISVNWKPIFNAKEIVDEFIGKHWIEVETEITLLGEEILSYMQQFITSRIHRDGSTGNLVKSINIEYWANKGVESPFAGWGIGKMSDMDKEAPYWYLINYGGMSFVANFGMGIGGSFNGEAPDPMKAGSGVGTQRFGAGNFVMFPKSPILPMGYIEASRLELDKNINLIIQKLKG